MGVTDEVHLLTLAHGVTHEINEHSDRLIVSAIKDIGN
jgi:hypothetical protein